MIPKVDGSDLVDVACGQGIASRHLAGRGARVTAIDPSEAMIELAERPGTLTGPDIRYLVDDAQTLSKLEDLTFEGAVCQLGLMDIAGLEATLTAISRVLKPEGWFVFVIGHPCFPCPRRLQDRNTGRSWFDRHRILRGTVLEINKPRGVRRAGNYHMMLSTYMNALADASFHIEIADEPRPDHLLAEQQPVYGNFPMFFAARGRKIGG